MINKHWTWDQKRPQIWNLNSEEILQDHQWFKCLRRKASHPDGRSHNFLILECRDWVQCLALTQEKQIVLVSQYRAGSNTLTLELPGGSVNQCEETLQAACRELREESGFSGHNPTLLYSSYPNPAMQTNRVHFYLLTDCKKTHPTNFDPDEDLATYLLPLKQLDEAIADDIFQHAITLTGLLLLQRWLKAHPQYC